MGFLSIILGGIAAYLAFSNDQLWLAGIAATSAFVGFWSYGVMHNYAIKSARQRPGFKGDFDDITLREADSVPNWITVINFIATIGSIISLGITVII